MEFYPGFDIKPMRMPFGFWYGGGVFGPEPEIRRLDDIRPSLENPLCDGPEMLYAIVMDVGREEDREELVKRNLLYGAVTYAAGMIGKEPVRSQGHIHAISPSCGSSTPEVYEIWEGEAVIYMQESGEDDPGACYAVHARAGDVVLVPPRWVHAAINGDISRPMSFGAWCVRDYRFDYGQVRRHGGIAYFPYVDNGKILWKENSGYHCRGLTEKAPGTYQELGIESGRPVYTQFLEDRDRFSFVTNPGAYQNIWEGFKP